MAEVTVLMACRNGAEFLPAQLESLAAQEGVDWRLIAGDDGSSDGTLALLETFSATWPGRVLVVKGPGQGVAAHFLALLAEAGPGAVAFADQDDVWLPGKLKEALAGLRDVAGPAMFLSRVAVWKGEGEGRALPVVDVLGGFGRVLVQNLGPGHAMVVNAEAAALLGALARQGIRPEWHDWWALQVVLGAGGRVILGERVQVLYRQHGGNVVGQVGGFAGLVRKARRALDGSLRAEMDRQLAALAESGVALTPEAQERLAAFRRARSLRGIGRAWAVLGSGVRRGGVFGGVSVALAALVGGL